MKRTLFALIVLFMLFPTVGQAYFEPIPEDNHFYSNKEEVNKSVALVRVEVVTEEETVRKTGSGAFIGGGKLLTALHVVDGATSISVELNGIRYVADLSKRWNELDVALLRIKGLGPMDLTPFKFAEDITEGDTVAVVGYPKGEYAYSMGVTGTTRLDLTWNHPKLAYNGPRPNMILYTTTDGGSSGSPVFDSEGDIVGIILGSSKLEGERISLAVPLIDLKEFVYGK